MYKQNTVITVAYDAEQINKTYVLDVTSKNFYYYYQFENLYQPRALVIFIFLYVAAILIIGMIYQLSLRFYLDAATTNFKILMAIIMILLGILIFLLFKKTSQKLNLASYLKKFPDSKQVTNKNEIDEIMNRAQMRSVLVIATTIGLFIWSVFVYRQFWNYYSFSSYLWATILFLTASALATLWKNVLFVMKLHKEMYVND